MRFKELLEYKRDITATNYRDKLWARLQEDPSYKFDEEKLKAFNSSIEEEINAILEDFEAADPSNNKQYVQWLLNRYIDNSISRLEDVGSTIADMLEKYHTLKVHRKLPQSIADIGKFKTQGQLIDLGQNINAIYDKFTKDKPEALPKGESTEILNNSEFRIIIPHDEQASCYYGQGTQWCTAAKNNNMFNHYSGDGPLFVVIPKNPEHPGQKFQLHFCSGQFMDETDSPVGLYQMELDDKEYGKLFAKYDNCAKYHLDFHVYETIKGVVEKTIDYIREFKNEIINNWAAYTLLKTDIEKVFEWNMDTLTDTVLDNLFELHENDNSVPYTITEIPSVLASVLGDEERLRPINYFIYDNVDVRVDDDFNTTTEVNRNPF